MNISAFRKRVFFLLFFALFFARFTKLSLALAKEFKTEYKVTIKFDQTGKAAVLNQISLTNNFANIYPKEYRLETTMEIQDIAAWDQEGNILKAVEKLGDKTKIALSFNRPGVGKGKKTSFTVKYLTSRLSEKKGNVWEINIPAMENMNQIDNYSLKIIIPSSFGNLSYSSIKPQKTEYLDKEIEISFSKKQLRGRPLVLAFGNAQFFDFSLIFFLNNRFQEAKILQIAIPPDTASQDIYYQSIDPKPINVKQDENGNWLAEFLLSPKEKVKVSVKGKVKILPKPRKNHYYNDPSKLYLFLGKTKHWDIDDPKIQKLAQELKTPKAIYRYVVDLLEYNFNRVNQSSIRKGASVALKTPKDSVCTEFTDLFIAIARAAGIPAREIQGYAYTTNTKLRPLSLRTDILHAWPEYWDKDNKIWKPVDPTWEKTTGGVDYFNTFDLNHFTFVIHGTDSEFPAPPGSYPDPKENQKTVFVSFSRELPPKLSQVPKEKLLSLKINTDPKEKKVKVEVKNLTLLPLEDLTLKYQKISSRFFQKKLLATRKIKILPPYGREKWEMSLGNFAYLISMMLPTTHLFEVSATTHQQSYGDNLVVSQAPLVQPTISLAIVVVIFVLLSLIMLWCLKKIKNLRAPPDQPKTLFW